MDELMSPKTWELGTADLIQQLAILAWLNKGEDGQKLYETLTGARVAYEIYNRLSGQRDIDTYQAQCIMGIAEYVKKHPKASEDDLAAEINKQIALFAAKVDAL